MDQKKYNWIVITAVFCLALLVFSPGRRVSAAENKNVLFISSYSLNFPTVADQIEGIKSGLGDDAYLYYEFMDSKAISSDEFVARFYQYISYKYGTIGGIDAVIAGDDEALQMVLRYKSGFFKDIPVIYESVDSNTRVELANSLGMVGIPERNTIGDNLELARKLKPDATRILALSDKGATGQALSANLKAIESKYAPMKVEILDTSSLSQRAIVEELARTDGETILLFLSFSSDADGRNYTYDEAMSLVTANAKTPVFTLVWTGGGSLGGIEANHKAIGKKAGEMTGEVLSGIPMDQIKSESTTPTLATFDMKVMQEYGIRKYQLPKNAIYVNDSSNATEIITAFLAVGTMALLFLLARSSWENEKRKANECALEETSAILRTEAELDGLTGLGNRRTLDRELKRCAVADRRFVLYLMDLDAFKSINDHYGHLAGDAVLQDVGRRLNSIKCRSFVPYRYGGDEFAVMYFPHAPEENPKTGEAILGLFQRPVHTEGGDIPICLSVGGACYPSDAENVEDLIKQADQALYYVKNNGKNSAMLYRDLPEMAAGE